VTDLVLVSPSGAVVLAEALHRLDGELSLAGWIEPGEAVHVAGNLPVPEALARLEGLALDVSTRAPRRMRLLVADMDSTIIGCECLDELADFAGKKAQVSAITERAMAGELDFEGALTERVAMLAGLPLGALEACFADRVRLNPGAEVFVRTMSAHGARCALVSGGFTFFTHRVAGMAGFQLDRANTLEDDGEVLTGMVGRPILGKAAKLAALLELSAQAGHDAGEALAIGDGANDLAMVEAAGLGVAYRAKPVVAAQAAARIDHGTLESALFFQGYSRVMFAGEISRD
jgi:phosphoserine phosphatase